MPDMPDKTKSARSEAVAEIRYPTAELLASKVLKEVSGYQQDFAKALLTGPDYALQEAKDILERFFKGGGR